MVNGPAVPMVYVHRPKDVPQEEHFVILEFDSVYIPGDERSRTNPGHGYGEQTLPVVNYIAFASRQEWEMEVHARTQNSTAYSTQWVPIIARKAKVRVQIEVGE